MGLKERAMNPIKMLLAAGCLWAGAVLADPPPGYPFVGFDAGLAAARASGKPIFCTSGATAVRGAPSPTRRPFPTPR
jgi:hypothetical protein